MRWKINTVTVVNNNGGGNDGDGDDHDNGGGKEYTWWLVQKTTDPAKLVAALAAEAKRRGYDGVVCGHIHYPALREEDGLRYANCGDWIENCTALVEDHQGKMRLLHHSDKIHWQELKRAQSA